MANTNEHIKSLPWINIIVVFAFSGIVALAGVGLLALIGFQAQTDQACENNCNSELNWVLLKIAPWYLFIETIAVLILLMKVDFKRVYEAIRRRK